jgi:hypothetical protein
MHDASRCRLPAVFIDGPHVGTSPLQHGCEKGQILGIEGRYDQYSVSLQSVASLFAAAEEWGSFAHCEINL